MIDSRPQGNKSTQVGERAKVGRVRNQDLRSHSVTVAQPAQPREAANLAFAGWANCGRPTRWRVLREAKVRTVLLVVAHIFRHQPFQMPLIQDDHVIQQVSSAASHPTLGHSVLPGTAKGGAHGFTPYCLAELTTSSPNFASRSNSRNRCAGVYGHASRNCCTIHRARGFRVTLK